eukprot:6211460-Pleurochrysis_carterae.AAC.2
MVGFGITLQLAGHRQTAIWAFEAPFIGDYRKLVLDKTLVRGLTSVPRSPSESPRMKRPDFVNDFVPMMRLMCHLLSYFRQWALRAPDISLLLSDDRRKAICCVSLRYDYESEAKLRVAWKGELTLPKTTLIYLL